MSEFIEEKSGTDQTNSNPQIDLEKGVVTLKKGDDLKTYRLNDQNDLNSLIKLGQRGWYYDDEASVELGNLRKVVTNWDSLLDAAKSSDEAMEQLAHKIEMAVGRPLTRKEEKQVEKGEKPQILLDEEENGRLLQTIDSMMSEINNLKKSQAEFKKSAEQKEMEKLQAQVNAEADRLEKVYDGKEGSPKFNRKEIYAFASEKGISDLEMAFKLKNFDQLTEYAQKKTLSQLKDQQDKRKAGYVESGDQTAAIPTEKAKRRGTYHKLGQDALKFARNSGLDIFTNES